ncbi:MAG: TolC family outer membrane protein [Alphaproteobacteria bacterium]
MSARALVMGFASVLVSASPSLAQTLKQALTSGYNSNPGLAAERAGQVALDEAVPQALAGLRPTITVTADIGATQSRLDPGGLDNRSPRGAGVALTWPVFDGFQTQNRTREARASVEAGRAGLENTEQKLFTDIAAAYGDVVRDRAIVVLQNQNVGFLKRQLYSTTRRQSLGDLSRTDVAQARSRWNQARTAVARARAGVEASQAAYLQLVGAKPGRLASKKASGAHLPATLEVALQLADQNNPAIRQARQTARAARHNVEAQKGALLPSVNVQAKYDFDAQTSRSYNWSDERSVTLNVSVPLYAGGLNHSRVRQAGALATKRQFELEDLRRKTAGTVIALWQNWKAARQRIKFAKNTVAAAKTAVRGVKVEAKVGQRTVIDVLDAQREQVFAQIELAKSRRDALVFSYDLLAAIGGGTARQLDLPVQIYDAQANLARVQTGWAGLSGLGLP